MKRRTFVATVAGLLAAPLDAAAQRAGSIPVIGVLNENFGPPSFAVDSLRRDLREIGYVEGQTIALEIRFAGGKSEAFPALAAELARRKVDVLVAVGPAALKAASAETTAIPIVTVALETDPVEGGYARSIAHPGGNITGVFLDQPQVAGKWLELVKEVAPTVSHVAILWVTTSGPWQLAAARAAGLKMGLDLQVLEVRGPDDLDTALDAVVKGGSRALIELPSPLLNIRRMETRVSAFAIQHRLPTISMLRSFAVTGGLLAYGPNLPECFRRAAVHVDKILKGAKPADLPIEQPTKFELVINLKTAKALGLTIPPSVLARADEVIQ
jgi:putative tryptophan/tyrosine transport system substrate-binding protein